MLKLIPYYFFQVDAIEGWLDEQAQKGLFLSEVGYPADLARFTRGEPRKVRYRIDIKQNTGYADEKERTAAYKEMGWDYVCDLRSDLDIYRCGDPDTPELNTDEETLHSVLDSKLKGQILYSIALLCLIPVWFYVIVLRNRWPLDGSCGWLWLCIGLLFLAWLMDGIACITAALSARRRRLLRRAYYSPAGLRLWRAVRWSVRLLPVVVLLICLILLLVL